MLYFAYGSNLSSARLGQRLGEIDFYSQARLNGHELRFHKIGSDGSGKCNIYPTNSAPAQVIGVIYEITEAARPILDRIEGVGYGYNAIDLEVETDAGERVAVLSYQATRVDHRLQPFHWYKHHVITGAREHKLPSDYIAQIEQVISIADPQPQRHQREMAIHSG
ncbi:MAG: hypothetical protein Tsb002_19630 [Wenzhouxiangellaceae bacterium]